jgi:fatty acid desaturase
MSQSDPRDLLGSLATDDGLCEESSGAESFVLGVPDLERALMAKEVEKRDESLKDLRQDREQRKTFSSRIFVFMCIYMLVALVIVFLCGLGWLELTEAVLITLLTTALANVIGVFNFVAKYLFHHDSPSRGQQG